jgi:serine/threonine protein kinase
MVPEVLSYGDVEFPGTERFRIERRLGEGGMGVVYEAFDLERNLPVALKTLRGLTPDGLLRFKQEFRLLRDLVHPNFVRLHELHTFGEWWFFTMELVDGRDVLEHVRGHPSDETMETGVGHRPPARVPVTRRGEPLGRARETVGFDEPRLRAAMAQLARALTALHARGLVHRDIKPHNILVGRDNRIVLLDFGIMVDPDKRMSSENLVVGTSDYMAPEQAAGG